MTDHQYDEIDTVHTGGDRGEIRAGRFTCRLLLDLLVKTLLQYSSTRSKLSIGSVFIVIQRELSLRPDTSLDFKSDLGVETEDMFRQNLLLQFNK
jgi:hypothetical protein